MEITLITVKFCSIFSHIYKHIPVTRGAFRSAANRLVQPGHHPFQEDCSDGDGVGTLDCGHDYYSNFIKRWLMDKNICPISKCYVVYKAFVIYLVAGKVI